MIDRRVVAGLLGAAVVWFSGEVRAEPDASPASHESRESHIDGLELDWSAPPECPSRAHVLDEIERLAARRSGRALHANVRVEHRPSGYHGRVEIRAGQAFDERDVEGDSCAEIADASALLVALALDRAGTNDEPTSAPSPPPPSNAPPLPPSPPPAPGPARRESRESSRKPSPLRLHLGAVVGFDAFILPRSVATLRPTVAISVDRLYVGVEGFVSPSVHKSLPGEPTKGARFDFFGVRIAGCWSFGSPRIHGGPCVGGGAMGVGTASFGVAQPRDIVTWTAIGTVEGRLFWRPRPFFEGVFEVILGRPLQELEFSVAGETGSRQLYHSDPVTLTIGIGVTRLWNLF